MKFQSVLKGKSFSSFFIGLLLFSLCGYETIRTTWADEADDFMTAAQFNLSKNFAIMLKRFHNLVMKKYCPSEYETLDDHLKENRNREQLLLSMQRKRLNASEDEFTREQIALDYDFSKARADLIEASLEACEQKDKVIAYVQMFNTDVTVMISELLSDVEKSLRNDELGISFEIRKSIAEKVIDTKLETDFNPEKMLEKIEGDHENDSDLNLEYLLQLNEVAAQIARKTAAQAAPKTNEEVAHSTAFVNAGSQSVHDSSNQFFSQKCSFPKCKKHLLMDKCGCGGEFCEKHYRPEAHSCTVDPRVKQREILKKRLIKLEDNHGLNPM